MTKADLIGRLMQLELAGEQKLTRIEARDLVTACFDEMKHALERGEVVDVPFGRLSVAQHSRKPLRGWLLDRVRVTYRKRKFIKFVPADALR